MFFNLIVFYLLHYYYSYITIPFKKEFFDENKTIFDELLSNNLKISIKVGKPVQKIPFYLNLKEYGFFINSNYFKINNSKTYKKLNVTEYEEIYEFIDGLNDISYTKKKDTIESTDEIIIGKENIHLKNISFLIHNQTINNYYGILGLNQYYNHDYYKNYNIICQLKEKKSINSYSFFIEYKNDNEGKLIIGAKPHEIYKKKFDIEYFNIFKNVNIEGGYSIKFHKIYFNNNSIFNNLNADLFFENGMIRGTNIYRNLIEKNFFEKFIEQNLCFRTKKYLNDYEYIIFYHCKKKVIENFPTLNFQIETKFEFEFDKNDLFYNINDISYFLIYFKNIDMGKWILGKPFFKKYLITFDHDKKTISYYTQYKINEFKFKFTYFSLISNVILIIIIIILFYYLYYYFKYKIRKIRANELIEDDNYNNNSNINQQYIEL